MLGVPLDPFTGRPETSGVLLGPSGIPAAFEENMRNGWKFGKGNALDRAPDSVKDYLRKGRDEERDAWLLRQQGVRVDPHMAAGQFWEMLEYATIADGTQVLNTTTETIMVPDFTIPAGWMYPGRAMKYTIFGNMSTVITTPGTTTVRLRWGGVAGTSLCASGAFAPDPTAASTTVTVMFQWYLVCRSTGSSGSIICMGAANWADFDDASATTIIGNLNMTTMPVSAPAATTVNTTSANALSPTITFSVNTATTQFTANMAFLESLS